MVVYPKVRTVRILLRLKLPPKPFRSLDFSPFQELRGVLFAAVEADTDEHVDDRPHIKTVYLSGDRLLAVGTDRDPSLHALGSSNSRPAPYGGS